MRKLLNATFPQSVLIFCLILSFVFVGDIQTVKAESNLTVEGVWEVISVSSDTERDLIGIKISISRKGDIYEIRRVPDDNNPVIYTGNERRIVRTEIELLNDPTGVREGTKRNSFVERAIERKYHGQQVPINYSYTLSADGNFLTREQDSKRFTWEFNPTTGDVRNVMYEIIPGEYKRILKRISGPTKAESHGDRAYQADCGKVDPNRTTPFPPDHEFCPGNLVCMTNFCGGGMGCPYVCCPRGLPYLNHCDCKCYATSDFDCHSYSYCKEKPIQ
jgi:hypothetical protein